MRYTLLLHYLEGTAETLGPDVVEQGERAFASYAATLQAAEVLVGGEVLQPSSSSTTVRMRDGALHVQDGPLRRHQGPARRDDRHRRARPRRGDRMSS